ncbi:hypothetical protein AVEN_253444-1, partial [Araneus ventricosus]
KQQSSVGKDDSSNDPNDTHDTVSSPKTEEKTRTTLSEWLKRSHQIILPNCDGQRLSQQIDRISRIVFPSTFAMFLAAYFLIYAVIMPTHSENSELLTNYGTN